MKKDFFNLIAWKELLLMVICLIATRIFILKYFYAEFELSPTISELEYGLFVLSAVLLFFSACMANHYFGIGSVSNKEKRETRVALVSSKQAKISFWVLSIVAVGLSFAIGVPKGFIHLGFISVASVIAIWLYADRCNRQLLTGKFIVSALCALLFILPTVYELFSLMHTPDLFRVIGNEVKQPLRISLFFAVFAFVLCFLREVIKDLRDKDDDEEAANKDTFAMAFGEKNCKNIAYILTIILILTIGAYQYLYYQHSKLMILGGISVIVHLPLLYFLKELRSAQSVQDYDFLAGLLKMVFVSLLFTITTAKYILQQ